MTTDSLQSVATDDDLLRQTAEGETAAFGELFRRHRLSIYRFAVHMTGRPAAAEDVVQEVFLRVMRDAGRYVPGRSSVAAWLCGIARNCACQWLDRERPLRPIDGEPPPEPVERANPDPFGDLARAEGITRLRRAVLSLPVHYREVVVLCDLQEQSYAAAAAIIGCAVGTVRSRLFRGRELLAAKLGGRRMSERATRVGDARCPA